MEPFIVPSVVCICCLLVGYVIGRAWQRAKDREERYRRLLAEPQPPQQEIVLIGGPHDGKRISVWQGTERVKIPHVQPASMTSFWSGGVEEVRPQFGECEYRRDLVHYCYQGSDNA